VSCELGPYSESFQAFHIHERGASAAQSVRQLVYLSNVYPAPSHTFIRREIAAVEALGFEVHRFAHRSSKTELPDPADRAEARLTRVLSQASFVDVLVAVGFVAIRHPLRFMASTATAIKMALRMRNPKLGTHLGYLIFACLLATYMHRHGVGHIHAHMATNAAAVAMLCHKLWGISYSFTAHATYEMNEPTQGSLDHKVAAASFVVTVSEHGRRLLSGLVPRHDAKIKTIGCGLDTSWMEVAAAPVPDNQNLVCVARLDEHKDQSSLVRAIASVKASGLQPKLLLVGDGSLRREIEALVAELELLDDVRFAGWQEQAEIVRHLSEARAMVLATHAEGLPVAIMEAFACGRPVIATDVDGVGELVQSAVTGWLVPHGNLEALSDAIKECLLTPPATLETMGQTGRRLVLHRHDARRSAVRLSELFERVTPVVLSH
jgi:colanic acid/amylovoran biosynthesis glycosyltransferase